MKLKTLSVRCPSCGKEVLMKETEAYRPFCSRRCKLIDLGAWADEDHRIPGDELSPEDDLSTDPNEPRDYD